MACLTELIPVKDPDSVSFINKLRVFTCICRLFDLCGTPKQNVGLVRGASGGQH